MKTKMDHPPWVHNNYPLIRWLLFGAALLILSSLYVTVPLLPVFAGAFHVGASESALAGSAFSLFFCRRVSGLWPFIEPAWPKKGNRCGACRSGSGHRVSGICGELWRIDRVAMFAGGGGRDIFPRGFNLCGRSFSRGAKSNGHWIY